MPRYDDNHGNTRLFVGHLSSRTRSRDLERLFSRYGRIRKVDMKHDFAFVDFSDPRDADDARYNLDHREVDGSRITVEYAKGVPRGSREYLGRGPPPGSGRCFNCGLDGHWARDCKAGDWKNKCYRCGERGHKERDCKNSPKKISGRRSYSRSPVRSRSPHRGRSRDRSYSRDRSHTQSRSPVRRGRSPVHKDRSVSPQPGRCYNCGIDGHWARDCKAGDLKNKCYRCGERGHKERDCKNSPKKISGRSYSRSPVRSRSPHRGRSRDRSYSRDRSNSRSRSPVGREGSPVHKDRSESPKSSPPSSKIRNDSPTLDEGSPQNREDGNGKPDGSDYSKSPGSPKTNGGHIASPRDDRSPIDDLDETRPSPRGSESP